MRIFLTRVLRPRRVPPPPKPARPRPRLEALESRLAPSWGAAPPATIPPPADAAAVRFGGGNDARGTATITGSENDFYTFVAPAGGGYRFSARTPGSNLNPVLAVYTAAGRRVAANNDLSGTDRDSQLTVSLTAGARYYFGVTSYAGTPGGTYTWQVAGPADDRLEDNDTRARAANLGALTGRRAVAGLAMADAADWFRFTTAATAAAGHAVTVTPRDSRGDLALELFNTAGTRLRSADGPRGGEAVSLSGLGAGTYYVRVTGTGGPSDPGYTLDVAPPPAGRPAGAFDIALRVHGLTASQRQVFERAGARWERVITGDLPDASYRGVRVDDLLIDARAAAIDGPGGVAGRAQPDRFRAGSRLPIHGTMEFDTADLANLEASGRLYDVVLHEIGHVLGVGMLWGRLGLLAGAGTGDPRFVGPRAVREYNALFGGRGTSVPVEGPQSGRGSQDAHWREAVFGPEVMSPSITRAGNPISRVTVASLADLGYAVDLAAADPYAPPR